MKPPPQGTYFRANAGRGVNGEQNKSAAAEPAPGRIQHSGEPVESHSAYRSESNWADQGRSSCCRINAIEIAQSVAIASGICPEESLNGVILAKTTLLRCAHALRLIAYCHSISEDRSRYIAVSFWGLIFLLICRSTGTRTLLERVGNVLFASWGSKALREATDSILGAIRGQEESTERFKLTLTASGYWDTLARHHRLDLKFFLIKEADMRRVLFLTFFCIAAPMALAQDPIKVDAKHYKVMLENDQVRVLKIHYGPNEKSVMHEHPAAVVVFLNDSKTRFTLPDGSTTDANGKAGDVVFSDSAKHLPQNVGNTSVEAVLVELKAKPGTASSAVAMDPVKVDPARHKVEFENDRVRVLRINLKPHDKTKQHEHPSGAAVYLTDVKAKFTLADGKTREGGGKRGEATLAPAEKHIVENTAGKPAEIILVELK